MTARDVARRAWRLSRFAAFYVRNLVAANLFVARQVLSRRPGLAPAIVRYPLTSTREWKIVLLANLISLTPGTLTIDIGDRYEALYVHAMHVSSTRELRAHLSELEQRLLKALQ